MHQDLLNLVNISTRSVSHWDYSQIILGDSNFHCSEWHGGQYDSFSGHITAKVQTVLKKVNCYPAVIPVGCISKAQPLSIAISLLDDDEEDFAGFDASDMVDSGPIC